MGKTQYISVLRQSLDEKLKCSSSSSVVVPVHGPIVTVSSIIDGLRQIKDYHKPMLFHLDIAPSVGLLLFSQKRFHTMFYRHCGKWIPFCSVCWFFRHCVIDKGECGDVIPPTCMPLRSLFLRYYAIAVQWLWLVTVLFFLDFFSQRKLLLRNLLLF